MTGNPPATRTKPRRTAFPDAPFTVLGHERGIYYYLSHGGKQIVPLTTQGHTLSAFLGLAPLEYWERNFDQIHKKGGPVFVANCLIKESHSKGIFDPSGIRGRGAWWDEGRSVMHAGNCLIVDGERMQVEELETDHIYEAGRKIKIDAEKSLSATEASRFGSILSRINWEDDLAPRLAAGWCVCALVAGALDWHPHIWLSGASGSGKTWLMKNLISPVLEGFKFNFKGSVTTEAGIRRSLAGSSLPVMFDDTDDAGDIQKVLQLMRACSQSGEAKAVQAGGPNGSAVEFELQSCFMCSSINIDIKHAADYSRITILKIVQNGMTEVDANEHFAKLCTDTSKLLTPDYCARFQARAIRMIPLIRATMSIMVGATAKVLGSRRAGDQMGALLAGAWSLQSDKVPTLEEATKWIELRNISNEMRVKHDPDEIVCMRTIAQSHIRLDGGNTRRVDELVRIASAPDNDAIPPRDSDQAARAYKREANAVLRRHGIAIVNDMVAISNNDTAIKALLRNTTWANSWSNSLARIPGMQKLAPRQFVYERGAPTSRSVAIPLDTFLNYD